MNLPGIGDLERRLFLIGTALTVTGSVVAGLVFGLRAGISVFAGGALAALNLFWLGTAVARLMLDHPKRTKHRALAGFFLRLMLIPLVLYVMIRFLFLSIPAAVAGFALYHCSVFVEGILEAFGSRSK